MNKDNGIKPQDISLKPHDNKIDINIKIPEKAINNILNSQMNQQQQAPGQTAPAKNNVDSKTSTAK